MKVLVTGANGQLGYGVMAQLKRREHQGIGTDIAQSGDIPCLTLDITKAEDVEKTIASVAPDAVIHCAAWTAVDLAEESDHVKRVIDVNAVGSENIAKACGTIGCKLVYISTDYVFDGSGDTPWQPDCRTYHPLNVYGKTKLWGENAVVRFAPKHFIVRTAWLYGKHGDNFVNTMLRLGETHDTLRVVNDQIGTPTYAYDLGRLLVDMIQSDKYGKYHATNEGGYISRCDFAREIFHLAGMQVNVVPVTTEEYGQPKAARPLNGRLDTSKIYRNGLAPLPDWKDALKSYLVSIDRCAGFSRQEAERVLWRF